MIGFGEIISFFVGAFIGHYFEEINEVFARVKKDLNNAQKDFSNIQRKDGGNEFCII